VGWGRLEREFLERGMSAEVVHLTALSEMEAWSATPGELAEHMSGDRREARRMLNRLARAGWVRKVGCDTYSIARERWPEAEVDLHHLQALRRKAAERRAP
jgi:DNA-binding IclR family transcriptional regulator